MKEKKKFLSEGARVLGMGYSTCINLLPPSPTTGFRSPWSLAAIRVSLPRDRVDVSISEE